MTLNIRFPNEYAALLHVVSFVNFSAFSVGSPKCHVARFDYIDKMQLITLLPMCILAVTTAACVLHVTYIRSGLSVLFDRNDAHRVVRHYSGFMITAIYLILPSVRLLLRTLVPAPVP